MNLKKLILSILTVVMICMTLFLCSCTKRDGDVGDNPDHSATHSPTATNSPSATTSPSATIAPTSSNTESPLESMIPDVME